ncbi:MAG: ribosome biogenesis factor YjgA [Burkholderiaceae bacterium]|nr:ribosome biogenesis factor YjgA [Burkholderiaceae bacterium]
MSRKPKRGYYVKGHFVAEGSELDLELKAELKGTTEKSKTDLKRESDQLQDLGEQLLTLRADLLNGLGLSDKLMDTIADAKRITNFEGRRRQMQFIGKLMRLLEPETLAAAQAALDFQHKGSAEDKLALHQAEQWRDRLVADDAALTDWLALAAQTPGAETDPQHLRALIRQARKDAQATPQPPESQGTAVRHGKAYREIFQIVKATLSTTGEDPDAATH